MEGCCVGRGFSAIRSNRAWIAEGRGDSQNLSLVIEVQPRGMFHLQLENPDMPVGVNPGFAMGCWMGANDRPCEKL